MRSLVVVLAIAGFAAAAAAFLHMCATGAAREALGILGCFAPIAAWLAYDFGRASR